MFGINKLVNLRKLRTEAQTKQKEKKVSTKKNESKSKRLSNRHSSLVTEEGPVIPGLLPTDTVYLRSSWKQLKGTTGLRKVVPVAMKIFDQTFKNIPIARNMFNIAAFARHDHGGCPVATAYEHSRRLTSLLDFLIEGKSESDLEEYLNPEIIGGLHTGLSEMGFDSEIWEVFGQSFADVMVSNIVIRACPNGARTWNMFIALLIDRMRAGYEQKRRHEKFGKSSGPVSARSVQIHNEAPSFQKKEPMRSRANTCGFAKLERTKKLEFRSNSHAIRKISRSIDIANLKL